MLWFIAYVIVGALTYYFGYKHYYDRKSTYDSDGEFQFYWLGMGVLWIFTLPCLLLWEMATFFRPKPASVKAAERKAKIVEQEEKLYNLRVSVADLEHENGYELTDKPDGWVPKDHHMRPFMNPYTKRAWF